MLEVLAVLAVAAVIGAGSLEGFTSAMRKYRANELITEASGRALAVSQQLMVGKELKEADFGGYPATDTGHGKFPEKPIPLTGDEFFKIPITGMDKATCDQMKAIAGGSLRRVDCKEENGKVTADLIYQKDLSETAGTIPGDTEGTSAGTGNSATRSYDNNREGCEEAGYQYCSNNICITKEETCTTGSPLCADEYPGTSEHNTGGYAGEVEGEICRCPTNQVFNQNDKECIPACSGHGTLDENETCVCLAGYTGEVCENQVTCGEHGTWSETGCVCDEGWYGSLCDSDCDGFKNRSGECFSCSELERISASKEECLKCDNTDTPRTSEGASCYRTQCPSGFFHYTPSGSCAPCSKNSNSDIRVEWCYECDGTDYPRKVIENGIMTICVLETCPTGNFHTGILGCTPCSNPSEQRISSEECSKCDNTETPRFTAKDSASSHSCYLCSSSGSLETSVEQCAKCSQREMITYNGKNYCVLTSTACNTEYPEGGFRENDGECYSCSYSFGISTSQTECDQCNNSSYKREMYNGRCVLSSNLATPCDGFRDNNGACHSCSDTAGVSASQADCDKCSNREMMGNYCALSTAACNAEYPEGAFRNYYSSCYSCSDSHTISTYQTECNKCGELRYYSVPYCHKK